MTKAKSLQLVIEPRPVSTWGVTLANRLPTREWQTLRRQVFQEAEYKCQLCGAYKEVLHCHEVWGFDDKKRIQYLDALRCVCETCHNVIHFGRSTFVFKAGYLQKLIRHWCVVNDASEADFRRHQAAVRRLSRKRADKAYIVQIGNRTLA